ncbi:MAG: DNA polymerase III subunit chi, partial [Pseudomonadales bacterium]|nr:DNA polymerase III subunit chi [Pseudomonadales bacterium]
MDTSNSPQKAAHLLDDLESIRQLLGDEDLQPPLLTEMVGGEEAQIPLLSEVISEEPEPAQIP